MTVDWSMIAQVLLTALLSTLFMGVLAFRWQRSFEQRLNESLEEFKADLQLRTFERRSWWELKREAYAEIIESLVDLQYFIDRRLRENRRAARRSVIALRERGGRTLTDVFLREREGVAFAHARIAPGSHVVADMIAHWDLLEGPFHADRIDHSAAYSFGDGIHTNGAESFFSRLRRMIRGQHHRVGPTYLQGYAAHAAWLEDYRTTSNGDLVDRLIGAGLFAPVSRAWKGYWQREC